MKKVIGIFISVSILVGVIGIPVLAQETSTSTTSIQELIQTIRQKIEELKAQIEALSVQIESLRKAKGEVKETAKEIKAILQIAKQLDRGMRNEDITLLQEVLATDPDIYPEGLITGYFGPLTEKAVKKFQKVAGIEQVGRVGPITLAKINELLEEGAGSSGKVPPGLLIAPGIRKKLGFEPQPLPGQELPPGISKKLGEEEEEEDTTAPVISEVTATSTTVTSTKITWTTDEEADSKVYYDTSTPLVVSTSTPAVSSSDLTTSHEINLTDLTTSTTYYYLVTSADAIGNNTTSSEQSFTTLSEEEEDTVAPVISEVAATSTTATSTKIAWTTDEEANSKVYYDTSSPLVVSTSTPAVSDSDLVTNHDLTLSGLTVSSTYYYLVTSADAEDNTATSTEQSFTTLSE